MHDYTKKGFVKQPDGSYSKPKTAKQINADQVGEVEILGDGDSGSERVCSVPSSGTAGSPSHHHPAPGGSRKAGHTVADLKESDAQTNNPRSIAVVESDTRNEPLAAREVQKATCERFLVRVTSVRRRLLDEDNLCEKFHIDLCRYAGMLPSDAPDKTQIEVAQRKAEKDETEHTEIVITP